MEEKQIGLFIRDRRLALGMTQQQLADRLGITDKAVSKWERAVSYPDITLLRDLADALEVTVSELLAGEQDRQLPAVPPEVENVVLDTVSYAETARRVNSGWRYWTFVALTAGSLIAALVLFILSFFAGSSGREQLLLAIRCVAFGWAVCYPLLRLERRPIRGCLVLVSFAIFPFLWTLLPFNVFSWSAWITLLAVAYLWAVYFICRKLLRTRMWLAAGWCFLLGAPLYWGILLILASRAIYGSPLGVITTALTAGACFLIDFTLHRQVRQ